MEISRSTYFFFMVGVYCVQGLAPLHASTLYMLQDLGTLGGSSAAGMSVNQQGKVAGSALTITGDYQAFVSQGGPITMLDTASVDSRAAGINDKGQVVGTAASATGPNVVVWESGQTRTVMTSTSYGLAINNNGAIAGANVHSDGQMRGFVLTNNGFYDVGTLGGAWSSVYGLNDAGTAVGYSMTANNTFGAFSWTAAGGMRSLGTLGGASSYGMAVNDRNQSVGHSQTASGYLHAFLFDSYMQDLGTLGGTYSGAYGINESGQVVGLSTTRDGSMRGFLYSDGRMMDLTALLFASAGWTVTAAYGINDSGQITGSAIWDGVEHAILLNPTTPLLDVAVADAPPPPLAAAVSEVPEPSTWLLSLGALFVGYCCKATVRRNRAS